MCVWVLAELVRWVTGTNQLSQVLGWGYRGECWGAALLLGTGPALPGWGQRSSYLMAGKRQSQLCNPNAGRQRHKDLGDPLVSNLV